MDASQHRAAIADHGGAIAALDPAALDRPVAACPGWTLERLVGHLGRVHVWATSHLAGGPDSTEPADPGPRPPSGADVLPWYRAALDGLLTELDRHDPSTPARTLAGTGTAAFWFRRQAHELAVHRWDADDAVSPGGAPPLDAALAEDGLDEWLGVFVPRWLVQQDRPIPAELLERSVHLHCTDDGLGAGKGEWLLRITPDGPAVTHGHAKGDAALRGPASDLLLAVWHRVPLERIDVVGDMATARAVLELVHVT